MDLVKFITRKIKNRKVKQFHKVNFINKLNQLNRTY